MRFRTIPLPPSWRRGVMLILAAAAIAFGLNGVSLSRYHIVAPGAAVDVRPLIRLVGDRLPPASRSGGGGILALTTVGIGRATLLSALAALLTPWTEIVPIHEEEQVDEEIERRAGFSLMEESKRMATVVALREAGFPVRVQGGGVEVMGILAGSRVAPELQVGDVITAVNGEPIHLREDLVGYLERQPPGGTVRVSFLRGGRALEARVATIKTPGLAGAALGIYAETYRMTLESPVAVEIETGEIYGSSAGLMMTLAILERLRGENLTHGFRVAGTGTIVSDGRVGGIEGVRQKLVAAQLAGAHVFLVPSANAGDAMNAAAGIRIVPIRSVRDALDFLRSLPPSP